MAVNLKTFGVAFQIKILSLLVRVLEMMAGLTKSYDSESVRCDFFYHI
jgi:hypothetical protein